MNCELCGKNAELIRVKIEGIGMSVCNSCSRFGKKEFSVKEDVIEKMPKKIETEEELLVENFKEILRRERENKNLKQEELAKKLNEKESVVHKLENGQMEPSLKLIKKLEKFFDINLIKKMKMDSKLNKTEKREGLTLGDLLEK